MVDVAEAGTRAVKVAATRVFKLVGATLESLFFPSYKKIYPSGIEQDQPTIFYSRGGVLK